jgi:hypothetical protein
MSMPGLYWTLEELVDRPLVGGLDLLELQPHPRPSIAPRDARFDVQIALAARQAEPELRARAGLERAGRAHGDAAAAQIEGERGGDGVAEPVRDRDSQHDAGAGAPVEAVGEQVRRQRRQDVLDRTVLVDVADDAQRRQLAHLVGARDRAAEDQHGQPARVDLAQAAHEVQAGGVRQPEIEDDQVDPIEVRPYAREQLHGAAHGDRAVTRLLERRLEAVPHEAGVVRNDDGLRGRGATRHPL